MFGLDVQAMCENTASENIHIWFPPEKKPQPDKMHAIKSYQTQDPEFAYQAFKRGGASLYFGSSEEFRNAYCKRLSYELGMNFSAYFNDYQTMGEIETFISKKNNYTDFHIDFQENFTLQISGKKKWRLFKSDLTAPLLGYTPHYFESNNLEA